MKGSGTAVSSRQTSKGAQTFKDLSLSKDNKSFHCEIIEALRLRAYRKNKIIQFPEIWKVLSWWKVKRGDRFEVIGALQRAGFLRIVKGHGVILGVESRAEPQKKQREAKRRMW